MRVVLYKEDGEGDQEKTRSLEEFLHGDGGVAIGQHDHDHHEVSKRLDPSLEGNISVVGPEDTHGTVKEEQDDRSVRPKDLTHASSPREKHHDTAHDESREDEPIESAPFQILVGCHHRGPNVEPLGQRSRRADRHPSDGNPEGRGHPGFTLAGREKERQDETAINERGETLGHLTLAQVAGRHEAQSHDTSRKSRCRSSKVSTLWISAV